MVAGTPTIPAAKLFDYIQQENSVLHERLRKLEISLAAEREACAKVAEEYGREILSHDPKASDNRTFWGHEDANSIAALIRGRT